MQALNDAKETNIWSRIPRVARYALIAVASLFVLWLAIRLTNLIAAWTLYSWFFEKIHTIGALPDFISGALAVWCTAAVVLFTPTLFFSLFLKRSRKTILFLAGGISLWMMFLYGLEVRQSGNLFNPITGRANYNYDRTSEGIVQLYDPGYVFDPATGEKLKPLDPAAAEEYRRHQGELAQWRAEKEALEKQRVELEKSQAALRAQKEQFERSQTEEAGKLKAEEKELGKQKSQIQAPPPRPASQPAKEIKSQQETPADADQKLQKQPKPPLVAPKGTVFLTNSVQDGELFFEIGCRRSGVGITCGGRIHNKGEDGSSFAIGAARIVDYFGRENLLYNDLCPSYSGLGGGVVFPDDHFNQYLEPNEQISFLLLEKSLVGNDVRKVEITLIFGLGFDIPAGIRHEVKFKEVPIAEEAQQ